MRKLVKAILIFFSSLLVLIIAAAIIIPLAVDLNDFKSEMEVAVQEKTGRALKIEGDLDLSVFPWLGVSTGKILLSNASGFEEHPFAVIGEADIKVKLLPLFSKKVEVSTLVLKGLELHLEKNKQGITNWNDLIATSEPDKQPSKKQIEKYANSSTAEQARISQQTKDDTNTAIELTGIKISGLVIENSQVSWTDQQAGQQFFVKDFNFSSGAIAFNQPIAIKLAMLIESSAPVMTEQLALSTNLVIDETLQKIQLTDFKLDSVSKGESIPGGIIDAQLLSEIALDIQQQTLSLKDLQLNSETIKLTGDINMTQLKTDPQYTGALQFATFSPKSLMQQLAMKVPETSDKQVLQKLALNFGLRGTKNSVALENLQMTLDDTVIKGSMQVKQFDQPAITFQLAIDDIDVDRYSAPKQEKNSLQKQAHAPIENVKTVVTEATLLPMDTLRILNLNGDLAIAKLKIAGLKMAGVTINIQAKDGVVQTRQSIKQLYQGNYQGQIKINAKGKSPSISLNEKMNSIQLEPLLNDLRPNSTAKLKGKAHFAAKLTTHGNTMTAIKSGLGGTLNFSLAKGAIRGFNLQEIIDIGRLAIKGKEMQQSYANEQTLFTLINGTAKVKKGLINNPDFLAESSTIEVKGGGTANLVNEALDYKVVVKAKKGGKDITERPVAIKVQGTFSNPSYVVDLSSVQSMMTEKEKQKVDKFINKHEKDIDKALGKGTGKAVNKLLKGFFGK